MGMTTITSLYKLITWHLKRNLGTRPCLITSKQEKTNIHQQFGSKGQESKSQRLVTENRIKPFYLKSKCPKTIFLFLEEGLVELVDDSDGQEDTGTCTDSSHKVSNDRQGANTHTSKGSRGRDVTVENMNQGRITVSLHYHLVVTQLLGNITSGSTGDFNPSLGEEGAGGKDEDQVKDGMEWIVDDLGQGSRRRDVVGNSSDWDHGSGSLNFLPLSEQTHEDVGWGTVVEELGDEVKVGNQRSLKDNRHVGSVEKLDWVVSLLSTVLLVLDRKVDTPSLEVDNDDKDQDGSHEVGQVRKILTVESLTKSTDLVVTGDEKMEQGDDGTFELSTTTSVDGSRTEGLPDDVLTNVGGDEKGDTRSKTVSLL
mmetsp:Transcript_14521/g.24067  ORF Transcript_14521/g.24067 Transcript_14521/m.24067 type:complete len:368 (+) Transcript_14521:211-1314(+)